MCEERLTLARQTPSPAIWELHAFTPSSVRCAFTRSLFVYRASRAEKGGEEAILSICSRPRRLYKLRSWAWFVQGAGFSVSWQRLSASAAAPWRPQSARIARPASARAATACCPRPPTAPRGAGARTPGTMFQHRPEPPLPHLSCPRPPSSSSPLPPPPFPRVHAHLLSVLSGLGSRLLCAPLLPTPQIRRLLETVG